MVPPPGGPLSQFTQPARRGAGVGAFLLAIVTAGALAHVGVRLKGLEVAYDLGRERRVATDLEEQRRRLQIEIGMLKDPGRVISIARDKLNMGPPAPEAIRRLGSGALWTSPPQGTSVAKSTGTTRNPQVAKSSAAARSPAVARKTLTSKNGWVPKNPVDRPVPDGERNPNAAQDPPGEDKPAPAQIRATNSRRGAP